ncbi:hypothetical protein THAR02_00743 [Trichoderma harzianum]|uniref:Uncharacterized protein n=1 Tax=Trichoderma harzianum TaxID=5544 RepID=A0A0G0A4N2_TRIHA|nr:hypothetical protein THAR02_00743 [Trichoderma harzianum]
MAMPPFIPGYLQKEISKHGNLAPETTNSILPELDEPLYGPGETVFSICLLGVFIAFFITIIIWDVKDKYGRGLASFCSIKVRNAFTKIKSFAKRRERTPDPDDDSDAATVATGPLATNHVGKASGLLSGVELGVMITPFEVPFTEGTSSGEEGCGRKLLPDI